MSEHAISIEVARKVLSLVDRGLVSGLGIQIPGQMCVEAAVCCALGLPHNDNPPCVGSAVRAYKIQLNDASWSSNKARAQGMRRVAIAQLGSDVIDQHAFADYVVVQSVRRVLPIGLRHAHDQAPEKYKPDLLDAIALCEGVLDIPSARLAADRSKKATAATAADAYAAAATAADAYATAADAYATAAYAAAATAAAAYAAAATAAAAYAAARDKVLSLAAEIAVEALQAQGCQGCEWLSICDEVIA